jgi:TDG/mug DNA glycosylase family protein
MTFSEPSPRIELSDIIEPGVKLLIVGFNPSLVSWDKGHHYANPVNNFYRLLYRSGLTPRLLKPDEDMLLPQYGIGLTNFVLHIPSANESQVPASTYREGKAALDEKIEHYQPRLVCFNGMKLYSYYFGKKLPDFGLQQAQIAGKPLFVTPSSSGAANMYFERRAQLYREMKELLDTL